MRFYVHDSGRPCAVVRADTPIRTPQDLVPIVREFIRGEKREFFLAVMLNTRHIPFRGQVVSIGSLSASIVHPREVFAPAIVRRAASIILCHNHPSGDSSPSEDDIEITGRLRRVGELVGIEILDHVIVGKTAHFSFREAGLF